MRVSFKYYLLGLDVKEICLSLTSNTLLSVSSSTRAQSFTSLKADLCQDINGGVVFQIGRDRPTFGIAETSRSDLFGLLIAETAKPN